MEYNRTVTVAAYVLLVAIGVGGLLATDMMATSTVLMMVLPSMALYGALNVYIGTRYGEFRATTEFP
ncbi:MAG: hypothetical protein ABEJ42_04420 [Halobacteriaceae archaeon]